MKKTICELFAGVGGFRLGFERESKDWKTVWFSQWEPGKKNQWAHDCYVSHWGDIDKNTGIDIAMVNKDEIPEHNLLVGGFPCQDYSVANSLSTAKGIEGKKGVLWWQIRETLIAKKAPFVLLENVDRLIKSPASQRGRDFGVILSCLNELGYYVEWRIINAAEYGAAQRRRRTFIFAASKATNYYKEIEKLESNEKRLENGFFNHSFPVLDKCKEKEIDISNKSIIDVSNNFSFEFENAGNLLKGVIYTAKVSPIIERPTTLRQIVERNVDEKYYIKESFDKWKYLKGAKKIPKKTKEGFEYMYSEGPIAFPDPLDLPARTMLTSESSVSRMTHVIEDLDTKQYRILTPIEAERIQGFDDNWTNTGMPEKFRYFCMGNALVVPMITRMAKELDFIFENE